MDFVRSVRLRWNRYPQVPNKMKKNVQALIPTAITAIRAVKIPEQYTSPEGKPRERVDSEYFGYVSSLGAGIIQGGLLPAVIFFENSDGEKDKYKVCQALRVMLENIPPERITPDYKLSEYILDHGLQDSRPFLRKLTRYAVSLKIALRTFEKK